MSLLLFYWKQGHLIFIFSIEKKTYYSGLNLRSTLYIHLFALFIILTLLPPHSLLSSGQSSSRGRCAVLYTVSRGMEYHITKLMMLQSCLMWDIIINSTQHYLTPASSGVQAKKNRSSSNQKQKIIQREPKSLWLRKVPVLQWCVVWYFFRSKLLEVPLFLWGEKTNNSLILL